MNKNKHYNLTANGKLAKIYNLYKGTKISPMTGKKHTLKWKNIMHEKMKNRIISDEQKEKISKTLKIKYANKQLIPWLKWHKMCENTKEKISKKLTGRKLKKEHIKKCLQRRNKSSLEIKFENIINKYKLPYKFVGNGNFFIGRKNPDFIHNDKRIVIEVFYTKHKQKFLKETLEEWKMNRKKYFNERNFNVLFFNETQVTENYVLKILNGGE